MKKFKFLLVFSCICGNLYSADATQSFPPVPSSQIQSQVIVPTRDNTVIDPNNKYPESPLHIPLEDQGGGDRFTSELINMVTTLGLILALMIGVVWLLKRTVNARMINVNTSSAIQVLDKRMLSNKATVYLLDVNGKGILVGESATGIARLDSDIPLEQSSSGEPIVPKPTKPTFDSIYKKKE
jgi:flagellar biogenesis protein FliO